MLNYGIVFLFLCLLFFIILQLLYLIFQKNKKNNRGFIDLNQVTLVVPFRNEASNLPKFLSSLSKQKQLPNTIIFVNDHSTDKSLEILIDFAQRNNMQINILELSKKQFGKKEAIWYGIQNAKTNYILTMDADVIVHVNYMYNLQKLPSDDFIILPVLMKGNTFLSKVFSFEYTFFNAFNFLLSPIYPVSASGANLLFNTDSIDYLSQLDKHRDSLSGDDYFLLKSYRKNKASILFVNNFNVSVETFSPESFTEYFNQRIRWFKKGKNQIAFGEILVGLFIGFYLVGVFALLLNALLSEQFLLFFMIIIIRGFLDALVFFNYTNSYRLSSILFTLITFQFIYPVLFLGVIIGSLFYRTNWKGRNI